ncbi:MAG: hypothetical protein J6T01_04255 [Kiritimatiellae bacterium]|nr:hypothetical protein [Kiritimatiellia bacterium]
MNMKIIAATVLAGCAAQGAFTADAISVKRVFRDARYTRGNTNILKLQPVDYASWIWLPEDGSAGVKNECTFLKFRKRFKVNPGDGKLLVDVSADERFFLAVDGVFVARGPNRAVVENWQYQTYEIDLPPGEHTFEATVWRTGTKGPLAQLSYRGGFVLKADGVFNDRLTTGRTGWEVGVLDCMTPLGHNNDVWGTGDEWRIVGTGLYDASPAKWIKAAVARGSAGGRGPETYGGRTGGWMLFPTQLPDQIERVARPGAVKAVTRAAEFRGVHTYLESETKGADVDAFNALIAGKPLALTVPAHTRLQAAWDLGDYFCAYPVMVVRGGAGAKVSWSWAESTRHPDTKLKGGGRGDRGRVVGKYLDGYGDIFVSDGRERGVFSPPWFRCGKWCRIDVETGDEPLEITDAYIVESRYPLEMEGAFSSPDDPTLGDIRRISFRAMQMCCHEMLFDCPYYEQQMYPGDTRVQLNVISAATRDDRIIRRAIELYDLSTRDDGQAPFNWPTRGTQEGATYTLCYLCMYGDYVMNHANREWLRARVPGLRKSMAGMEYYENAEGLLENLPGWQFMDWVVGWRRCGEAPGGRFGEGVNAEANLFWVLAMKSAALVERALGNDLQAQYWEEKRTRLAKTIVRKFWCAERGLLSDTPEKKDFSEHAQCLALLGDALPADKAEECFRHLVTDADLKRTTVYFSYYLFECYFKFGRGDLFQKRLDLWRSYVDKGLATTQEAPDSGKNGKLESRSDCHAWGAHPIWFMQTGLAGIKSAAPFFEKVLVAPCPGTLGKIRAKHPHPLGFVEVDLEFNGGKARGTVSTPVAGDFVYGDMRRQLAAGANRIE